MVRAFFAVLSVGLTIFALADCVQTEDGKVRNLPKWAWIVLIVLLPWVGPITWLLLGKDRTDGDDAPGASPRREGPLAPDEDPEFLRRLDEDIRREKRERRQREQDGPGPDGTGPDGTGPDGAGPDGTAPGDSSSPPEPGSDDSDQEQSGGGSTRHDRRPDDEE